MTDKVPDCVNGLAVSIRDVQNFNILLNMSDHVLVYCSWGQGTQKKIAAFNSFGKQWHRPRPILGFGAVITVVEFVELIRGKVLVYRVVDSEFSS